MPQIKGKKPIIIGLAVLVCVVVIVVCVIIFGGNNNEVTTEQNGTTASIENNNENNNQDITDETVETLSPEEELWGKDVKVKKAKTPYIELSYPKDEMKVEEVKEGSNYQLDFYGTDELKDYRVFSIFFGNPIEDSSMIGYLDSTPVFFYVYTDYTGYEDKVDSIYELQDDVNNIIWEISQSENFTKEQ